MASLRAPGASALRDGVDERAGYQRGRPTARHQRLRITAPAALCVLVLVGCGTTNGNTAARQAPPRSASLSSSSTSPGSTTTVLSSVAVPGQWGIYQTGGHCTTRPTDALSFNIAPQDASHSETDAVASIDNLSSLPVSLIAPRDLSATILDANNATIQSVTMPALPTELPGCSDARLSFTWSHGTISGRYTLELKVGSVRYETSSAAFTEHINPITHAFTI